MQTTAKSSSSVTAKSGKSIPSQSSTQSSTADTTQIASQSTKRDTSQTDIKEEDKSAGQATSPSKPTKLELSRSRYMANTPNYPSGHSEPFQNATYTGCPECDNVKEWKSSWRGGGIFCPLHQSTSANMAYNSQYRAPKKAHFEDSPH